jgi:long-subunit acyl-CoA synthetase (AMP-forming)
MPAVHGMLGGRAKKVPDSTGILYPGMEARIVREDGSDADTNEPGELWLKGGNIALGYWDNEKANRETFVDEWLKTGDLFLVDGDGNF